MVDRQKYLIKYGMCTDKLFDRIDEMEKVLDKLSKLGNGDIVGNSIGNSMAYDVLNSKRVINFEE